MENTVVKLADMLFKANLQAAKLTKEVETLRPKVSMLEDDLAWTQAQWDKEAEKPHLSHNLHEVARTLAYTMGTNGSKIQAIKMIRMLFGKVGLREAKELIEKHLELKKNHLET